MFLVYFLLLLSIIIIPLAALKIVHSQATEWDFGVVVLNSLCLLQVYKFFCVPITAPSYYGASNFFSVFLLVPMCGVLSLVWTARAVLPRLKKKAEPNPSECSET
ncbi:MAG: hypothetical protein U0931_29925 [Vulcanimicrobiota bacterium]